MKHNVTQREGAISNDSGAVPKAQVLIDLKRKVLDAKEGLLTLGGGDYMPYMQSQAVREGRVLDTRERKAIRQVMSDRVYTGDADRVEFIVRAVQAQLAA